MLPGDVWILHGKGCVEEDREVGGARSQEGGLHLVGSARERKQRCQRFNQPLKTSQCLDRSV